ncbi:transmembrane emp24 domain-containing protein 7 isoform X2 [Hydra vulgaris]|uniref:Transmembrane emp24 domain-containing protein 7 isoform X2 n=1 Tax=Hydra vulgaris TaxID=6087 RepID=A0ABM4CKN4_HYDVU
MSREASLSFIFVLFCLISNSWLEELTFELEDNERQCFHEMIYNETKCTLEFQVITGGHYDVDVFLKDPENKILYNEKKKQYDSHTFIANKKGEYVFCFSNEFSSFTHKTVYFDFQSGEERPLSPGIGDHHTALTMIETTALSIHESLKVIIDYQTHHRLRELTSREMAEYLYERVQYWSLGQTIVIVFVAVGEVLVLRNFFSEKRDRL